MRRLASNRHRARQRSRSGRRTRPPAHPRPASACGNARMCPEMIVAPAGSVTLGSPGRRTGSRRRQEGPQRRMRIDRNIAVSRFEVTRAEYEAFVAATGYPVRRRLHHRPGAAGQLGAECRHQPARSRLSSQTGDPSGRLRQLERRAGLCGVAQPSRRRVAIGCCPRWSGEYLARAGSTTAYPWGADVDRRLRAHERQRRHPAREISRARNLPARA